MKPTHQTGRRRLLTAADSVHIRDLWNEKARILARLGELQGREIATLVAPQIIETHIRPMARG